MSRVFLFPDGLAGINPSAQGTGAVPKAARLAGIESQRAIGSG